jgi:hypothetical protein
LATRLQLLQMEVNHLLERFVTANKIEFGSGRFDIHLANDGFLVELLREFFQAPTLRNLNAEVKNATAIDLVDDASELAIQVTGQSDLEKVVDTLRKVVRHRLYEKYPRVKVFVTTEKKVSYNQSSIDRAADNKLQFDGQNDILDAINLAKAYQSYETDRLANVARILRKQYPPTQAPYIESSRSEALERDLATSYDNALARSAFDGSKANESFRQLAESIIAGKFEGTTDSLRRKVLLRAARSAAVHKSVGDAERYLVVASQLPGNELDNAARARISQSKGDIDQAIRFLRDENDPESKSTLLSILVSSKGDDAAIDWYDRSGSNIGQLSAQGVVILCQIYVRRGDIEKAVELLESVDETKLNECPFLRYLRGHVHLASVFPKPDQHASLSGDPLAIFLAKPVLEGSSLADRLESAIADFQQVTPILRTLGLPDQVGTSERYVTWASLLHPYRHAGACTRLKADVREPQLAIQKIELALEFVDDIDVALLAEYLRKREEFGGFDDQELRALVVIYLNKQDHAGITNTIAKYRTRCEEIFGHSNALAMEIRALVMTNQVASAKTMLETNAEAFDSTQRARLSAQIAEAEGKDPTIDLIRAYEETKSVEALRSLIAVLLSKGDSRTLGPYAEQLYEMTRAAHDLEMAAKAYGAAGDGENFRRVVESLPILFERAPALALEYAWQLFSLGRLPEARETARRLYSSHQRRDFNLEFALAIESGQWEQLAVPLAALYEDRANQSALTLVRGAMLAHASGQGPLKDLIGAAVDKGRDDAQVLISAYSVAMESGIEGDREEAFEWFRRAVDLSGPDGPVQTMELKDVLAKQVEWQAHSRKVNDALMNGDVPLIIAASALHTKLVEVVLGNFVRNVEQPDPRKRSVIPLFSGHRLPGRIKDAKVIALDVSAMLVLGWLKVLPKVIDAFEKIILPAGAMLELFEGQRRVRQFQMSRVRRAEQIQKCLANGLKAFPSREFAADALDREIGVDLAGLIRAATDLDGVVVRPAPVHKLGSEMVEADMSMHLSRLTDMHELLSALVDYGAVDIESAKVAKRYFELQDRGWKGGRRPSRDKPLFLDELAVSYLQTVQLLPAVLQTFKTVYIDSGTRSESVEVLNLDRVGKEILGIVDAIRDVVKKADQAAKVTYGRRSAKADKEDVADITTAHLLENAVGADVVLIDDRAFNKSNFVIEASGRPIPIATSLDVLEELESRGIVSSDEKLQMRHRLRVCGAALVPVTSDEISIAAAKNATSESAEFRAIRESIGLVRIRETPRFPSEIPWLAHLIRAVKEAIFSVWRDEPDREIAAKRSNAIYSLQPHPVDWLRCWGGSPPPDWVKAVSRTIDTQFALPVEIDDDKARSGYNDWAESRIFKEMRDRKPGRFRAVIDSIKELIRS